MLLDYIHNEKRLFVRATRFHFSGGFLLGYWDHNILCNCYHNSKMERDFIMYLRAFFH
jgi:hypothetical protein